MEEENNEFEGNPEDIYPSMKGSKDNIEIFQDETGKDVFDYPSFSGEGLEEVSIPRPPAFGPHLGMRYESMEPGEDRVALKDAVPLVTKSINEAFREGNYQILDHYAKVIEGSDVFDQALMPQVKEFVEEANAITNREQANALLEKVNRFLGEIRMAKPEEVER